MDKERQRKLDELFEAFSVVAEGAYVYLCDMSEDISRWSKSAVNYFGLPSEYMENAGGIWEEHIHTDDRDDYHHSIDMIFSGKDSGHDMQYRAKTRDGNYVVCTCRGVVLRDAEGNPAYFGGAIKNHGIKSYVDTVTGLRSLYGFFEDLRAIFWKKDKSIILQLGISGFSNLNDVYGYSFGNRILQQLGRKVQKKFANVGAVYRMDGTKMVVISRTLSLDEVAERYSELQDEVSHDFYVDDELISLSLNAGLVVADNFDISDKTVYSCLKYAYSESKNRKLGDLVIFHDMLSHDNRKALEKINVIRNNVSENCNGFYLCYQPIMYASSEKLKGMEALVRWKNDTYGSVPPNQFIPILEQDTLFPKLGKWILKQAMTDGLKFLEKYPDMIMNVNLSYAQMEKDGFIKEVLDLLEETGFPANNLCLEITERCRLLDMELLKDMVKIFRDNGIRIALDDFGTGYASLGILRELPVDTVKIDREYVKDVEKSKADQSTVRFISDLADAFSAEVCVEGVETEDMKDFLKQYKVSSLQGYYYSKPVPSEEFLKMDFVAG
ncbi:MAG: EAL domain-containing protein [Lachnospiraceae bacterium]|nr:EAL domain-containing protein [Lachnospiraceae bacterium]